MLFYRVELLVMQKWKQGAVQTLGLLTYSPGRPSAYVDSAIESRLRGSPAVQVTLLKGKENENTLIVTSGSLGVF